MSSADKARRGEPGGSGDGGGGAVGGERTCTCGYPAYGGIFHRFNGRPCFWADTLKDTTLRRRPPPSPSELPVDDWDDCSHGVYEYEPAPTRSAPNHAPAARSGDDDNRWPIGAEQRPVGHDGEMRRVRQERPEVRLLRYPGQLVARVWRWAILGYRWRGDVGRAGVDRDGHRGSSTGYGRGV